MSEKPGSPERYGFRSGTAVRKAAGVVPPASAGNDGQRARQLDRLEDELLTQTAQVVEQVHGQLQDLQRREQVLTQQLGLLDQERRRFRLEQQSQQQELRECAAVELDSVRSELAEAREQIAMLNQELAMQRDALVLERVALEEERRRFEAERMLAAEDLDRQKQALEQSLATERTALSEQIEVERAKLRGQINSEVMTDELQAGQVALKADREQFQQTVDEWYARKTQEEETFRQQRASLDELRSRAEREIDELRRRNADELEQERVEEQRRLRVDSQNVTERREQIEAELRRQQALMESRIAFQRDHLERTKSDLEQVQSRLRVEQQQARLWLEQQNSLLRLRRKQIDQRHLMLEELEQSLAREHETMLRVQGATSAQNERERRRLATERETMELRMETQSAENRRQSDILALHAENLDKRRDRLDHLREELERRHQELLETRIAVDEAWAQLAQVTGDDAAQERVTQAREQLAEYCRQVRDGLIAQRQELDDARQQLNLQKDEFRSERQQITDWLASRESQVRRQEEQLHQQLSQIEQQESAWQAARDQWLRERLEAERIIRDLLSELRRDKDAETTAASAETAAALADVPELLGLGQFNDNAA